MYDVALYHFFFLILSMKVEFDSFRKDVKYRYAGKFVKKKDEQVREGNKETKIGAETRVKCVLEELLESCRSFGFIIPIQGLISYHEVFHFSLFVSSCPFMCGPPPLSIEIS